MSYGCKCNCPDFKTHVGNGPFVSATATPSRNQEVASGIKAEQQMSKDHAAYRRMKAEGLQPKSVRGVAAVERHADDVREITEGKLIPKQKLKERDIVREAMAESGMLT